MGVGSWPTGLGLDRFCLDASSKTQAMTVNHQPHRSVMVERAGGFRPLRPASQPRQLAISHLDQCASNWEKFDEQRLPVRSDNLSAQVSNIRTHRVVSELALGQPRSHITLRSSRAAFVGRRYGSLSSHAAADSWQMTSHFTACNLCDSASAAASAEKRSAAGLQPADGNKGPTRRLRVSMSVARGAMGE